MDPPLLIMVKIMSLPSYVSSILADYQLWFDGDITVPPSNIYDFISCLDNVHIESEENINDDIIQYNRLVEKDKRITIKNDIKDYKPSQWNIDSKYINMDVYEYIIESHNKRCREEKIDVTPERLLRLEQEFQLFKQKNMLELLRALIYIINTLISNNIVWGTGRGSSVSSYILYAIFLHDVDSYLYELEITDFIKDS